VSAEAQQEALAMASRGGEICFFAALPPGKSDVTLDTNLIHNHELSVLGSRSSGRRHFERAMDLIRSGKVDASMLLTHRVRLADIAEGFNLVKSGEAMKVVVRP